MRFFTRPSMDDKTLGSEENDNYTTSSLSAGSICDSRDLLDILLSPTSPHGPAFPLAEAIVRLGGCSSSGGRSFAYPKSIKSIRCSFSFHSTLSVGTQSSLDIRISKLGGRLVFDYAENSPGIIIDDEDTVLISPRTKRITPSARMGCN